MSPGDGTTRVCHHSGVVIAFDEFELDPVRLELRREGERVALEPQVFDVLAYLVHHADRVVPKTELLDEVWGSRFVSESALTSRIKSARQALGDDGRTQRYIRTAHGRGYRFVAAVIDDGVRDVTGSALHSASSRSNLPVDRTPLFGREDDIAVVADALTGNRLVSLLGIGGTGKTRLAVAAARATASEFREGTWFVDLVPLADSRSIEIALAEAVGLGVVGDRGVLDQLAAVLTDREVLVVFDNAEHVASEVSAVLDALLERTVAPRFLVTSRVPLGLPDERRLVVDPLAVDAIADDASDDPSRSAGGGGETIAPGVHAVHPVDGAPVSPAVALLLAAAERFGAPLQGIGPADARRICRHLDGLPLAIELAAAQLRHLDAAALAARLDRRFDVLTDRVRPGRERHASLQAVLADTWGALETPERVLLEQLAAFPATFTLDDLVDLAAADAASVPRDVETALGGLVDRSLVVREAGRTSRYRLLETVKLFTRGQCAPDRAREIADRHAVWCIEMVGDDTRRHLFDFEVADWCIAHHADLRAAGRHLRGSGRTDQAALLLGAAALAMHIDTGPRAAATLELIESDLEVVTTDALITRLHLTAVMCGMATRSPSVIADHGRRAVVSARRSADPVLVNAALVLCSWSTVFVDPDAALEMTGEAADVAVAADEPLGRDFGDGYRAIHLAVVRRYDEAEALARAVVERAPADERAFYPTYVGAEGLAALLCVDDPGEARQWSDQVLGPPSEHNSMWARDLVDATIRASAGEAGAAHAIAATIVDRLDRAGQDPWPDLLIPAAAHAVHLGERERAAGWLAAIREAGRPTQSFQATVLYRRLRDAVGNARPDDPVGGDTLDEVGRSALAWLADLD